MNSRGHQISTRMLLTSIPIAVLYIGSLVLQRILGLNRYYITLCINILVQESFALAISQQSLLKPFISLSYFLFIFPFSNFPIHFPLFPYVYSHTRVHIKDEVGLCTLPCSPDIISSGCGLSSRAPCLTGRGASQTGLTSSRNRFR